VRNFIESYRDGFRRPLSLASLKWNAGVNNFMTYNHRRIFRLAITGSTSLANLGLGHGAIDAGGGYTYFNPATGHEFSAVAGFTYNFKKHGYPISERRSDFHLDWGASQFSSKQFLRRSRRLRL